MTRSMTAIRNTIGRFLVTGSDFRQEIEATRKIILVHIIVAIGILYLVPFGFAAIASGRQALAVFDLVAASLLIIIELYTRKTREYHRAAIFAIAIIGLLYVHILGTGESGGTGHLWSFTFPLVVLFLLGVRTGSIVLVGFFAIEASILFVPHNPLCSVAYTTTFKIRFLAALLAVSVIAYVYEYTRVMLHNSMAGKNNELHRMLGELNLAEKARLSSEQRFRDISLSSSNWIWEVNRQGLFTYVGGRVNEAIGYAPDELIGTSFQELTAGSGEGIRQIIQILEETPEAVDMPCWIRHHDGRSVCFALSWLPFKDADGAPAGYRGVGKDITEQKSVETERSRIEENLRTSQKMEAVGQLAGGIAHDFNNILGSISGYAEMISKRVGDADPKVHKYAETILSASTRAADLTSKLLAFARRGKLQNVAFNIHPILTELVELLRITMDKRISISYASGASQSSVQGDPTQVRNALLNLALNAQDAMPEGGTLKFETSNARLDESFGRSRNYLVVPGPYLCIRVTDTGIGMDDTTKARLFEPFFTTKDIGKGTGLGLASVYGTVKAHKGYIEAQSELGIGTSFNLYLPCTTIAERAPAPKEHEGVIIHGSGTVMIVDDEQFLLDLSKDMLEKIGYTTVMCKAPEEAIAYYRSHSRDIDVVIIDMIMPDINGRDCFRRLKQINPSVKAILSTGYSLEGDAADAVQEGFMGLLQKPFVLSTLSGMVSRAMKSA